MTGEASPVPVLWDMDSAADYYECDCPGPPPPEFRLPPPPRPPPEVLGEVPGDQGIECQQALNYEELLLETCDMKSVIPAEPSILPALPSLAIVALFSLLLLTFILVAAALLCKHKKKMQNLLPCKSSPQNRCDVTHGNGVIYEDLTNIRPRPLPQPNIEMLDVKNYPNSGHTMLPGDHHYVSGHFPSIVAAHQPVFICSRPPPTPLYCPQGQDLYNPVYEELSNGSAERGDSGSEYGEVRGVSSEEDFAEDELSGAEHSSLPAGHSLLGDAGTVQEQEGHSDSEDRRNRRPKHCSSLPKNRRHGHRMSGTRTTSGRSNRCTNTSSHGPTSLDRRRCPPERPWAAGSKPEAYHEGLLVDALFQLYPAQQRPYVVPVSCTPYQSVPVISYSRSNDTPSRFNTPVSSFRPMLPQFPPPPLKTPSQDSDSGYSNNTSGGGTQSTGTSRGRGRTQRNVDTFYS